MKDNYGIYIEAYGKVLSGHALEGKDYCETKGENGGQAQLFDFFASKNNVE